MSTPIKKGRKNAISPTTIEALSRSIYKEACKYGFSQIDIIKLINSLMGLCSGEGEERSTQVGDMNNINRLSPEQCRDLPLTGAKLAIRAFQKANDVELLESWLHDKYGRYFILSCASAQQLTVESLVDGANNYLGIVTLPDGQPIGAMAYLDNSQNQRRAELRKLIGEPNCRGKGFAEEATRLWIQFGIHGLGLEKIYVSTLQTQISNIKLNEDIGFRVEGLLRNEVLIEGERHDVLRMGLFIESDAE